MLRLSTSPALRALPRATLRLTIGLRFNSAPVAEVTNLTEFARLIDNKAKPTFVDFYATWCGPCKAIGPIFDDLATKVPEAQFARVDVDRAEDVAREYGISAMPTILFFQDGEKVDTIVGANPPALVKKVEQYSGVDIKLRI